MVCFLLRLCRFVSVYEQESESFVFGSHFVSVPQTLAHEKVFLTLHVCVCVRTNDAFVCVCSLLVWHHITIL